MQSMLRHSILRFYVTQWAMTMENPVDMLYGVRKYGGSSIKSILNVTPTKAFAILLYVLGLRGDSSSGVG